MSIHAQQQRMSEQQDAVEACARALHGATERLARGHKVDAELIEAIAHLTQAVSMLVVEPAHRRLDGVIDAEHMEI